MIARHVEERGFKFAGVALDLVPLLVDLGLVLRVAFDQVADAHDELRLKQVELVDALLEHALPMSSRSIADDGELEMVGIILELEMGPRMPLRIGSGHHDRRPASAIGLAATRGCAEDYAGKGEREAKSGGVHDQVTISNYRNASNK